MDAEIARIVAGAVDQGRLAAFDVVRNKVSHSDTTLTDGEIKRLKDRGFGD